MNQPSIREGFGLRLFAFAVVLAFVTAPILSMAGESVLASGEWKPAFSSVFGSPSVSGDWRVVVEGSTRWLELSDDFTAKKAPDLKLFLSRRAARDITGKNAPDGAVRLAALESVEGPQRFEIATSVDLAAYRTIVLHCEQYTKLWGTAALEQ